MRFVCDRRTSSSPIGPVIRVSCGLAAVVALHAAALAILPAVAPMRAVAFEQAASSGMRVVVMQAAALAPPGSSVTSPRAPVAGTTSRPREKTGPVVAQLPDFASPPSPSKATRSSKPIESMVEPVRALSESGRATVEVDLQGGAAAVAHASAIAEATAADRHPMPGEIVFREQWELDEPPQFLHVPVELAELIERLAAPVDARVALFIDARGTVARIEIEGMIDKDDGDALSRALQAAAFAPGRLTDSAVASVKRIEMRGLDVGMRVVTASASGAR